MNNNPYLNQGYPNYPYQPRQNAIRIRPVTSIDEVRAAPVDFDGSVFFFPDLGNKKIYTKQINMDGTASLNTYIFTEPPTPKEESFVTKEELNAALAGLWDQLTAPTKDTNQETT